MPTLRLRTYECSSTNNLYAGGIVSLGRPSFEIEILGRPSLGRPLDQKKQNCLGFLAENSRVSEGRFSIWACVRQNFRLRRATLKHRKARSIWAAILVLGRPLWKIVILGRLSQGRPSWKCRGNYDQEETVPVLIPTDSLPLRNTFRWASAFRIRLRSAACIFRFSFFERFEPVL